MGFTARSPFQNTASLFNKYVTRDEAAFSQELYMSLPQLREMASQGMQIGGHGYNHIWLGKSTRKDQVTELQLTASFLGSVLCHAPKEWTMCYPLGSYNSETVELATELNCAIGLTTKVGLSSLCQPLELQRLDTNDLPLDASAELCVVTKMVHPLASNH